MKKFKRLILLGFLIFLAASCQPASSDAPAINAATQPLSITVNASAPSATPVVTSLQPITLEPSVFGV